MCVCVCCEVRPVSVYTDEFEGEQRPVVITREALSPGKGGLLPHDTSAGWGMSPGCEGCGPS